MRRRLLLVMAAFALFTAPASADQKIKVGISGGDAEIIWAKVKEIAAKDGFDVQVVVFNDYLLPNAALDVGDLDANAFQHKPFLDNQIKTRGYKIVAVGETIVAPIGLYSRKAKSVAEIKEGASIGIPNDPSNGGRALNLLAANGLIKLADGKGLLPSVLDIADNPKKLVFKEIDAAQIPNLLPDLDGAVINTNYALGAGLNPRTEALLQENRTGNPYGNFIAVRAEDKDKPLFRKLIASYQNKEVADFIEANFKGAILPAW